MTEIGPLHVVARRQGLRRVAAAARDLQVGKEGIRDVGPVHECLPERKAANHTLDLSPLPHRPLLPDLLENDIGDLLEFPPFTHGERLAWHVHLPGGVIRKHPLAVVQAQEAVVHPVVLIRLGIDLQRTQGIGQSGVEHESARHPVLSAIFWRAFSCLALHPVRMGTSASSLA